MSFIRKFIDTHKFWEYLKEKYETKIKSTKVMLLQRFVTMMKMEIMIWMST
jgi:hypothetical protein